MFEECARGFLRFVISRRRDSSRVLAVKTFPAVRKTQGAVVRGPTLVCFGGL